MPAKSLFGTSGVRGDAEELFTDQFCFDIGRSFAKFLSKYKQSGAVAVGMDPRGSSPRIKKALIGGVAYEKREVFDEGAVPSPAMCFLLQVSDYLTGSIMITGSHIKSNLNGVKFFAFNAEILKKHEKQFESIYYDLKGKVKYLKAPPPQVNTSGEAKTEYEEMLVSLAFKNYPKWRVVVDAGDGSQSDIMPQVLARVGVEVVEMNTTIQGEFYARDTENKEDFADLVRAVPKQKADFGMGFDADGDRVIFVDKNGNFIPGDYTASLIAKYSSSEIIVTPIATSQVVDHIGKKILRTKVGSPYLVEAMKSSGSKFAFEANGGGVSSEIMYTRDGGSTAIKLLNILAKSKKSLEEAISQLPKFYLAKTKIDYKWSLKDTILKKAREKFLGIKVEEMDGLKIWLDKTTWILFRSSMNAPEFRVFAESDRQEKADELLRQGISFVKEIVKNG